MKRLYTSVTTPGQGAVYRDLANDAECIGTGVVDVISGVGCTPDFPIKDNEYGKLPTTFPLDVEIDPEPFDVRLDILDGISYDPLYPDMWGLLDPEPDLQETVLEEECYCPGEGIKKPGLTTGRPAFPSVAPLPFYWFPAIDIPDPLTIREINPDSSLPGDCCPTGLTDFIRAEIVGNEIQLTHVKEGDFEEEYRTLDAHHTFQARAGFPKWCCVETECEASGTLNPEHVLLWMHFPRWPTMDTDGSIYRNPYDEVDPPEEPLGIIPIIPDIQCDPTTGILHVYHANIVVHDGIIAGLQWDTEEPRETRGMGDPTVAPTNPLDLDVNKDYQGNDIYPEATFNASSDAALDEGDGACTENCDQAIANLFRPLEACEPLCPQDGVLCIDEDFPVGYVGIGTGPTPGDATSAAIADLQATIPGYCDPIQLIWICFTVYDDTAMEYVSNVKGCCPAGP
jgi:hypothetical protein